LLRTIMPTTELYRYGKPFLDSPPPRRRSSAKAELDSPPRPPNAFILYRRQQQAHLRRACPGLHLRTASKLIAVWWKSEPESVRVHYRTEAELEKRIHREKYPDYQYKPKGTKGRKDSKVESSGNHKLLEMYYGMLGSSQTYADPQSQAMRNSDASTISDAADYGFLHAYYNESFQGMGLNQITAGFAGEADRE